MTRHQRARTAPWSYPPPAPVRRWRLHLTFALLRELRIHDPRAEALLDRVGTGTYWELETELVYRGQDTTETVPRAIALRSGDLLACHHLYLHIAEVERREEIFAVFIP